MDNLTKLLKNELRIMMRTAKVLLCYEDGTSCPVVNNRVDNPLPIDPAHQDIVLCARDGPRSRLLARICYRDAVNTIRSHIQAYLADPSMSTSVNTFLTYTRVVIVNVDMNSVEMQITCTYDCVTSAESWNIHCAPFGGLRGVDGYTYHSICFWADILKLPIAYRYGFFLSAVSVGLI